MPNYSISLRVTAAAAGLLAPGIAPAQATSGSGGSSGFGYGFGPHMMWWGGGWDTMFLGPFFMILIFAAIVLMAALALRAFGPARRDPAQHPMLQRNSKALEILRERFARGEIDQAEYEARRKILDE